MIARAASRPFTIPSARQVMRVPPIFAQNLPPGGAKFVHSARPVVPLRSAQKFTYGGYNLTARLILARSAGCLGVPHLLRGACALTGDSMHKTTTKGTSAAQRGLECLRDDCRRHDAPPIMLARMIEECEGRAPISTIDLRGPDSEVPKVKAFLVRFGRFLTSQPELWAALGVRPFKSTPGWDAGFCAAKYALLERAPALIVCETRASMISPEMDDDATRRYLNALPPTSSDHRATVPDVRLAIAEAIDAMLVPAEGRRKRTKEQLNKAIEETLARALLVISKKPEARNGEIAEAIGVTAAWFSRHISKLKVFERARAAQVTKSPVSEALAQEGLQISTRRKACKSA